MVALGGQQISPILLGNFAVDNLVPGTHNMVVYSLDGSFQPFQQGVTIAASAVRLWPSASTGQDGRGDLQRAVPANTVVGAPLRLAGNLTQLGNTLRT